MSIQRTLQLQRATQPSAQIYGHSVFLATYKQLTNREWTAEQYIILEQVVIIGKWLASCAEHYKRSERYKKWAKPLAKALAMALGQGSVFAWTPVRLTLPFVGRPGYLLGHNKTFAQNTIDMAENGHFGKTLHQAGRACTVAS